MRRRAPRASARLRNWIKVQGSVTMEANRILQARTAHPTMSLKKLCILLPLLLLQSACALAAPSVPTPSASLPGAPQTLEEAKAQQTRAAEMRKEADKQRSEIEATRKRDDTACYAKILVNACRDDVRANYIKRISIVRQMDIDANQLDRTAKARQLEIETAAKLPPEPSAAPQTPDASQSSAAHAVKPSAKPLSGTPAVKTAPGAAVPPAAQAKANQARNQRISEAEQRKQAGDKAAAERARKAREDKARYERHEREHAEKQAAKAAKTAASPPQSKP